MVEEKMRLDKGVGCTIKSGDIVVTGKNCDEALKAFKKVQELRRSK